ncbi:MAG: molybdopterin molybdotransferase MoeA [Caulobacteraceae bacterium]
MKLLSVDEARARMLASVAPLSAEAVPLGRAIGRALAADVVAWRDQPPFAASAMDGWAVRAADCPGNLQVVGESAAGHGFAGAIGEGEAVRIFTGAAVPPGADAVIVQEDARREGDRVVVPAVSEPRHIRPPGQDFRAGERLLVAGTRLDPWRLSLAAAAGLGEVQAARRPRVAILSTGEEIVEPGAAPGPFQIFNSGTTALAALVSTWGGEAVALAAVGDDAAATAAAVADAACDLAVTIGGASVGDHDLVKPALASLGLTLVVESVAVRPGKPTWFGALADGRSVLGLPGNPASALVCAELFLRSLLAALQGADRRLRLVPARAAVALPANGAREHWPRARLEHAADGVLLATPFPDQDSSLVAVFAQADALIRRPAGAPAAAAGDRLEILALERLS